MSIPSWAIPYFLTTGAVLLGTAIHLQLFFRKSVLSAIGFSPLRTIFLLVLNLVAVNAFYFVVIWILKVLNELSNIQNLQYTFAFIFGLVVILYRDVALTLINLLEISPEQLNMLQKTFDTAIDFHGRIVEDITDSINSNLAKEIARRKDIEAQILRERFASNLDELENLLRNRLEALNNTLATQTYDDITLNFPRASPERTQKLLSLMIEIFTQKELKKFSKKQ